MQFPTRVISRALFHLILLAGCVLVFLTPPTMTADEDSHLVRAYMVSQGKIASRWNGERWGQDVPETLVQYVAQHRYMVQQPQARYAYERWYVDSHADTPDQEQRFHSYSGQSISPLYYIPQSIGIWVGKALYRLTPAPFNWAAADYFSRLGNLFAYALVFAWAVRAAPRFAGSLMFLALTPMSLSLGASPSYDVTVILTAVAFFAAAMRARERADGPRRAELILLVCLAFMLGHSKTVYAPVMLVLVTLLKPMGLKRFAMFAGACGAAAIGGMLISTQVFGLPDLPELERAISGQAQHVREIWHDTPGLVLRSIVALDRQLFVSTIGSLGWLDTNFSLPALVAWMGVGLIGIVGDANQGKRAGDALAAGTLLAGAALALFALFLAMYITWTSVTTGVGSPIIDGVQGRYLLPLFPFVMGAASMGLSFAFTRPVLSRAAALRLQLTLSQAMLALMAFVIVARYWIPASPPQ